MARVRPRGSRSPLGGLPDTCSSLGNSSTAFDYNSAAFDDGP